jgi:hypothetical protein
VHQGVRAFSWFIYRITTPGLREIFMNPNNRYQLRDALLAVLAGNYRDPRLGPRLLALKVLYYAFSAGRLKESLAAWKKRREAARELPAQTPQPSS